MWLCNVIGHNFKFHGEVTENPYTGNKRADGKTPHTRIMTFLHCTRCSFTQTVNKYFFDYDKAEE